MSAVPPERDDSQPPLDPSGQWRWDAAQQQWIPTPAAYAAPPAYDPPGPSGGPPKSRTWIYIAAAVVVVLVAGALVGVFAFTGGTPKPDATVTTYLEDLAKGDAKGAIAQGASAPSSNTFLTDDILKQQQSKSKISAIKITQSEVRGNAARVQATYQFGSRSADETFELAKAKGKWKLGASAYSIDVSDLGEGLDLTLFGQPLTHLTKVYLFPGPIAWGSANKYYTVADKDAAKFALSPFDFSAGFSQLDTGLSDAGRKAAQDAVAAFLAKCAQSKDLAPQNCPQREFGLSDSGNPQEGSVTWTAPTDVSGLKFQSYSDPRKLDVSGSTVWSATYQSKSYLDDSIKTVTDASIKVTVYGTIDMTQTPPTFTDD